MRRIMAALVVVGIAVVAYAGPAAADSQREKWAKYAARAGPHIDLIMEDLQATSDAASEADIVGVEDACVSLGDTVDDAYNPVTRTPSKSLSRTLRKALNFFRAAAKDCRNGDYSGATTEITIGSTYIETATKKVHDINAGL